MSLFTINSMTVLGANYISPPNMTNLPKYTGSVATITNTSKFVGSSVSRVPELLVSTFGSTVIASATDVDPSTTGDFAMINSAPIYEKTNYYELEQSINKIEKIYTIKVSTAIRNGAFDFLTGKFDAGYPTVSTDQFSQDNAANITRNHPGSSSINMGSSNILKYNYTKKTG